VASAPRAPPRCRGERADHRLHREELVRRPRGRHVGAVLRERGRQPWSSGWGCSSRRRASNAGSAESQTPSEVSSWRALPVAPSFRRTRTAAAVRSEAGDVASGASAAEARVLARVRVPSAAVAGVTWETSSSRGSRTYDRQLRRHCCVEEDRVSFPLRAVAASAMRGKRRSRARASHVCSRSTACSRHVRARAQLEEAAMGTRRSVGTCVASRLRMSRPGGGAPRIMGSSFVPGDGVPCRKGSQHRRGAPWSWALRPHHRQLVAGQAHPQVVGPQPAVGRGGSRGPVDGAEVVDQGLQAAPACRRGPLAARAPRLGIEPHAGRVGGGVCPGLCLRAAQLRQWVPRGPLRGGIHIHGP